MEGRPGQSHCLRRRLDSLMRPALFAEYEAHPCLAEPTSPSVVLGSTAYADPLPKEAGASADTSPPATETSPPGDADRTLKLRLGKLPRKTELIILAPDGGVRARKRLDSGTGDVVSFALPADAGQVLLRAGQLESEGYSLDAAPGSTTAFDVDLESRFWGGFLRAMGFDSAEPYIFDIERTDLQPDPE